MPVWLAPQIEDARKERTDALLGVCAAGVVSLDPVNVAVDARYRGQSHELPVIVDTSDGDSEIATSIRESFESQHQKLYGQKDPSGEVELTGLKVTAVAKRATPAPQAPLEQNTDIPAQPMYDPTTKSMVMATIIHRGAIKENLSGPAIILQDDTTTVVQRGWTAYPDASGSLFLRRDNAGVEI